jgi:uncharacterized membrane protein YeaQ/YmgE (transglycosylase-associated protein family)
MEVTTPGIPPMTITIPSVVITLLVAALCGALAQLLVGYTRGGCLVSLLVGIAGALLGGWLARWLGLPPILVLADVDIVWTIIGSAIFVAVLALAMGGTRYRPFYRRRYD